jgi:hypothetical protein
MFATSCFLRYFALQSTVMVEKIFTVKLNSISLREFRHQRINNYLQTVLVRGKIAGRAQDICLYQGCQLRGFSPEKAIIGILLKNVLGPL